MSTEENIVNNTLFSAEKMNLLSDLVVQVSIELGRAKVTIRDLLALKKDSIVELDKAAGDPVDIYVNGKIIAKGNIINANGKYCVKLITVINESNEVSQQNE
jgi:flagellar motor switch protein FliN/FliY